MSTSKNPRCSNPQCHKTMRWLNEAWQCPKCSPCAKTIEAINRRIANGVGYRNRVSDSQAQQRRILAVAKPPKPPWEPVWAAQSTPEIVAAVREARAAQRRLKCIG